MRLVRALTVEMHENRIEAVRYLNLEHLKEHKKKALRNGFQESSFFQGVLDADNTFLVNGNPMNRAIWNLIISKRDLCLYHKCGLIPHRNWKISDVKRYYGLSGNIKTLLPKYLELCDIMLDGEDSGKNPLEK